MPELLITPKVIKWARDRAELTPEDLASKVGVKPQKLRTWEARDAGPTLRQAGLLANALHIPMGYLFLQKPPDMDTPIPDLRTLDPSVAPQPSPDFFQTLEDAIRKQEWYREFLESQDVEALDFVASFTEASDPSQIAADIISVLGLSEEGRVTTPGKENYLRLVANKAENVGISVLRSGVVGNNNHRPLDIQEFRGFALPDPVAPLVFVNARDWPAARLFTLIHELAHIWIGVTGISNVDLASRRQLRRVERVCNAVAANVLMPEDEFIRGWMPHSKPELVVSKMAGHFRVSNLAALIRAKTLGLIEEKEFEDLYKSFSVGSVKPSKSGGDFDKTLPARHGRELTSALLTAAKGHQVLLRDAADLLGVKVSTLVRLAGEHEP